VSNLLIVEGKSDKVIIESLIKHLNINLEVGNPICSIDKCEDLGGMGELEKKLKKVKKDINKEPISKVGVENRTEEIKIAIKNVFDDNNDGITFKIHILNIDGCGELEDILKLIKNFPSDMANCLDDWQNCLCDKKLNDKELNKLWIQVYQKYDCCTVQEQEDMKNKCSPEILLNTKKIYDFNKDIEPLNNLKKFLTELGEQK